MTLMRVTGANKAGIVEIANPKASKPGEPPSWRVLVHPDGRVRPACGGAEGLTKWAGPSQRRRTGALLRELGPPALEAAREAGLKVEPATVAGPAVHEGVPEWWPL